MIYKRSLKGPILANVIFSIARIIGRYAASYWKVKGYTQLMVTPPAYIIGLEG